MTDRVLLIDDDKGTAEFLLSRFHEAGLRTEIAADGLSAIEKLKHQRYDAVILDPMIRHGLNGYAVLNYIELEKPELMPQLFLLTALSERTIARTVPPAISLVFRKPGDTAKLAAAVVDRCDVSEQRPRAHRLLVVDDDHTTALLLQEVAQGLGYQPTLVHNGVEALDHLRSGDYVAILLDLVMPEPDGFTVLQYLKQRRPHLLPRVIVITGMPERYATSIDRAAICEVLQKPVDTQQLSAALQRCSSEKFALPESGGEFPGLTSMTERTSDEKRSARITRIGAPPPRGR